MNARFWNAEFKKIHLHRFTQILLKVISSNEKASVNVARHTQISERRTGNQKLWLPLKGIISWTAVIKGTTLPCWLHRSMEGTCIHTGVPPAPSNLHQGQSESEKMSVPADKGEKMITLMPSTKSFTLVKSTLFLLPELTPLSQSAGTWPWSFGGGLRWKRRHQLNL